MTYLQHFFIQSLTLLMTFHFLISVQAAPKTITLGFIPGDSPERVLATANDLSKALSDRLGVSVVPYIPKNYQELISAMKEKKVDFAFFTAMTFVFAERESGAKVLLKKVWKEPYYYSVIITKKQSKIRRLEDLKGQRMAFVDEKSTSGYLYPSVMLRKKKIDPLSYFKKVLFAGNHQAAVHALEKGEVDAAAVFSDDKKGTESAWVQYIKDNGKGQRVIWVSEPIPNDPFCVRKDFYEKYPQFTHDLMFALIDLGAQEGESPSVLRKLLDVKELKLATSRQYDPVREMVKELNLRLDP